METQKSDEDEVKSELPPEPEDLNNRADGLGEDGEAAATKLQRHNHKKRGASAICLDSDEDCVSKPQEIQYVLRANWSLDKIDVGIPLGRGKFGACYMARIVQSNICFALKIMNKKRLAKYGVVHQLRREIHIQKGMMHRNILRLYNWFQDDRHVYLMLELAPGGELYKLLQTSGRFSEVRASWYMNQAVEAIMYLHARGVFHRDIKPENILLGPNNILKVADFGWSVIGGTGGNRKTVCGTLDYLAPEMIKGTPHDHRADIWSLGVLMYEFLVGTAPFAAAATHETHRRIKTETISFPTVLTYDGKEDQLSIGAKELIENLLRKIPADRISLKEVRQHPWLLSTWKNGMWCRERYGHV